jgi:hypothetical protein
LGGSCDVITAIGRRYGRTGKNTQNQAKKTFEIENFEEDRRRKYTAFIPTSSHDYQNDAGTGDIAPFAALISRLTNEQKQAPLPCPA